MPIDDNADSLLTGSIPSEIRDQLGTRLRGTFLVLDGPDGSGKSTQVRLLERFLKEGGCDVLRVREPGGTEIGEAIRSVVLNGRFEEMRLPCELFLFMASRAQLVRETIIPAVKEGYTVIADRFLASTIAYQGGIREVVQEYDFSYVPVHQIRQIAKLALGHRFPDYKTFIFDIDVDVSIKRMHSGEIARHGTRTLHAGDIEQMYLFGDRMEYRAARFQLKVRAMYKWLLKRYPDEYIRVDANGDHKEVFSHLIDALCQQYHVKPRRSTKVANHHEQSESPPATDSANSGVTPESRETEAR